MKQIVPCEISGSREKYRLPSWAYVTCSSDTDSDSERKKTLVLPVYKGAGMP